MCENQLLAVNCVMVLEMSSVAMSFQKVFAFLK